MIRWAAVVAFMGVFAGCGGGASKAECEKMIEHVVDIYVKEGGSDTLPDDVKNALKDNRKVVYDHVAKTQLERCLDDLPADQVQCTLKAASLADIAKCEPE